MKKTRFSAFAASVAVSTALVAAPAEAQPALPAAPNFQQVQKQFDDSIRNALLNLWGPYEQLIRTFPQLKPILDPLVLQFLPPRTTTSDSLFGALNEGIEKQRAAELRGVRPNSGAGFSVISPVKRHAALDAEALRIANAYADGADIRRVIEESGAPAGFDFGWVLTDDDAKRLESELRNGTGDRHHLDDYHYRYAGTAVVERNGKTYGAVVFGGKNEYGPEDL